MTTPQAQRSDARSSKLSAASQAFWLVVNLVLVIVPSFGFFFWIERNLSLPLGSLFAESVQWPWVDGALWPLGARIAWNVGLFLVFGLIHSALAQNGAQQSLARWVPLQSIRTLYLAISGVVLIGLMGLWQHTGIVLWALPLSPQLTLITSMILFWSFFALSLVMVAGFDAFYFLGLRQLFLPLEDLGKPEGSPFLITTGIYSQIRHPMYLFTLLAYTVTPFMTLDRAVLIAAHALYLAFALPIEERKLVSRFGAQYLEYRKRVPALLPKLRFGR